MNWPISLIATTEIISYISKNRRTVGILLVVFLALLAFPIARRIRRRAKSDRAEGIYPFAEPKDVGPDIE